jgi:hypothetical protein
VNAGQKNDQQDQDDTNLHSPTPVYSNFLFNFPQKPFCKQKAKYCCLLKFGEQGPVVQLV